MKILQINKLYPPTIGGVETVVKDIAEGLANHTNMHVLVCVNKGKRREEVTNDVRITRAASFGTVFSMPISFDFLRQYKKHDADIIQLHSPFPLADLAVWLFGCKGKLVVYWHSDIVRQKLLRKLLSPFVRHTLKKADAVFVASERNIDASSFLPKYRHKIHVVPFGIDLDAYPPVHNNYFLSNKLTDKEKVKLLFVGRLVYYKGIKVLLEAMKNVNHAELFVVGGGDLLESSEAYVNKNGLGHSVHFLGSLTSEELLAAFDNCDIFVFPSIAKSEAFGLVQIEAMRYGKPVINTNLPTAVPWVSQHQLTGITVPVGNAQSLAGAINYLVHDDNARKTFGINAADRVREQFNIKRMLDSLLTIYQNLINR